MNDPYAALTTKKTPQTEQAHPAQVANSAGGFSFQVSTTQRLERFLILGTWGGSYYASEQKLTKDAFNNLNKLVEIDGMKVVDTILDISLNNRAYKQQPTLFALAVCASAADPAVRKYALRVVSKVCRTGTMFFQFIGYTQQFRGWGSGLRKAVGAWYTNKTPDQLATQLVKYRQRDGWTHRDALRLAKPTPPFDVNLNAAIRWAVGKDATPEFLPRLIQGFEMAQATTDPAQWVALINEYQLPWEALPTQALNETAVWEALVPHLGLTAVLRNLGKMGATGALVNHSELAKLVNARLADVDAYAKARVHPMQVLLAANTYSSGRGVKGNNTWTPVPTVIDSLNAGFYTAFGHLPMTNKRRMLALDVSGSMAGGFYGGGVAGTHLSPREASGALAMVALHQDPESYTKGFSNTFIDLGLSKGMRLDSVIKKISGLPFATTDCSLPMVYALNNKIEVDSFEVYTDSETFAGRIHPHQALTEYRNKMGIPAKLIVNGMVANNFTIADPNDAGSLDVVGFDGSTPQIISDFICG